jgi:hypothetical protein
MKTKFLLIFLFIFEFICDAQIKKFEKHSKNDYNRHFVLDSLNIEEPNFRHIDIQLRIFYWEFNDKRNNSIVLILTKCKNGVWDAKKYKYYLYNMSNSDFKNIDINQIPLNADWVNTWKIILENNYLNIPTESDVRIKSDKILEMFVMSDGNAYQVDILKRRRRRNIRFNNPTQHAKFLDTHKIECTDYHLFVDFMDLIRTGIPGSLP